ncbi:MAG: nicotinate-nucleotide adenylyltransferase [Lachnospiraceae bacterium]|nr:nicotinate-nucleotide adenylyltransferase [Lachnospiraceae bacterium]
MNEEGRRIGLFGGTFDPVHNAHLALARQAYRQYALDTVWLVPTGQPPHKRGQTHTDIRHRMEMIRLAIRDIPGMELCSLEEDAEAYHYTYRTVQILRERCPHDQFYFIMGADSLFNFENWREPGAICSECILLAAIRDAHNMEDIQTQMERLHALYQADIRLLNTPNMNIAAEDIRARIRKGADISGMLPASVEQYLRKNRLYEGEVGTWTQSVSGT